MSSSDDDITGLLHRWSDGDRNALDQLTPVIYEECRGIAARLLRGERADHTLSPTALVNELYLRLIDQRRARWESRRHFFNVTAHLMRRILVDYARSRGAGKRLGGRVMISLSHAAETPGESADIDLLALDAALDRLGKLDPDQVRIVELRFFGGMTVDEIAQVLDRSPRTVKREWQLAKAWLYRELHDDA